MVNTLHGQFVRALSALSPFLDCDWPLRPAVMSELVRKKDWKKLLWRMPCVALLRCFLGESPLLRPGTALKSWLSPTWPPPELCHSCVVPGWYPTDEGHNLALGSQLQLNLRLASSRWALLLPAVVSLQLPDWGRGTCPAAELCFSKG